MAAVEIAIESRGARLLRDLERAYRSLSPAQQRSIVAVFREACEPRVEQAELPLRDAAAGAA